MIASEVESLFASKLSPLTESKIKELLGKDDVSELLDELLESGKLKRHEFAPDLSIYWPASWYQNDHIASSPASSTTSSPTSNTSSPTTSTTSSPMPSTKESKPSSPDSDPVFKTPSKPPEKQNHLSNTSDSLKARLARKKRTSTLTKTPPTKTTSTPLKNTVSTPLKSTEDTTNENIPTTEKNKAAPSSFTTPSPKRRKVAAPSKSPVNKEVDIASLEKEKKRLLDSILQKEAMVAKKNRNVKPAPTPTKTSEKKARDDKQLEILTKKWRAGCEQMLADLQQTTRKSDGTGGLSIGQMIDTFQFERSLFPNLSEDGEYFE